MFAGVPRTGRSVNPALAARGRLGEDAPVLPLVELLRARKRMNDAIRRWFDARGFLEVETPIMVVSPGIEPHLDPVTCQRRSPDEKVRDLYLHTSPEYAMKRLLGRGAPSCYQLARVFRDGEASDTHVCEFTMLEFYRRGGALAAIEDDVIDCVKEVARALRVQGPGAYRKTTVSELFREAGLPDPLQWPAETEAAASTARVRAAPGDAWDDVYFRAFFEAVEPRLDPNTLYLVGHYPARMAALAELDPQDPRRALRTEVFWGALELGNGYQELCDPIEQRRRFEEDLILRRRLGRPRLPIDDALLRDLRGLPRAAGIAIGVDRLFMKMLGAARLSEVLPLLP